MLMSLLNRLVWNTPAALTVAAIGLIVVAVSIYREWRKSQHEPNDQHYWNP